MINLFQILINGEDRKLFNEKKKQRVRNDHGFLSFREINNETSGAG